MSCPKSQRPVRLALEHIGRSIWGLRYSRESLFAVLTCYFDEGGGIDHGFIVVAGYV
jgi:hypothetical protein